MLVKSDSPPGLASQRPAELREVGGCSHYLAALRRESFCRELASGLKHLQFFLESCSIFLLKLNGRISVHTSLI